MLISLFCADVCTVGITCTPMGGFLGSLLSLYGAKVGSIAIEGKHRTHISASWMGNLSLERFPLNFSWTFIFGVPCSCSLRVKNN